MSDLLRIERNFEQAISKGKRSYDLLNNIDSFYISKSLLNLGNIYLDMAELDKAEEYYESAIEDARDKSNREYEAKALNNRAILKVKRHKYESAIEDYKLSAKLKKLNGDFQGTVNTYWNMAILYERLRQFENAINIIKEALFLIKHYDLDNGMEISNYLAELEYIYNQLNRIRSEDDKSTENDEDSQSEKS